jgi:hypothetical protein
MAMQNTLALPTSLITLLCCLTCTTASTTAKAEKLKRADIDDKQNVHIVTARDQHAQITNKGTSTELKLAPDNETVAWLVMNSWIRKVILDLDRKNL